MSRKLSCAWLVVPLVMALAGCSSIPRRQSVSGPNEPWCGVDLRAEAYLEKRSDGVVRETTSLRWTCAGAACGDDWNAVVVAGICDEFLKARGVKRTPEYLDHDAQPWPFPLRRPGGEWVWPPIVRYEETATVVSFNPLVVLMVPVPFEAHPGERRYDTNEAELGYRYSTTLPYADHVQWFCPGWSVVLAPAVAATGDPLVQRISLPGVEFLLTRDGDKWAVSRRMPE